MQPTQCCDGRGARTLHQVKGIHHNSLDTTSFEVGAIYVSHDTQRGIGQEGWEV
jgi:hypothetical protein